MGMRKKHWIFLILPVCCHLFHVPAFSVEAENPVLSIGGLVQSPIQLTLPNLQQFRQETISIYENIGPKGKRSVRYGAVPLRSLIELAKIQDPIRDLAVSVKNNRGEQIVLSWGEIFLPVRNRIFIAGTVETGDSKLHQDLPALILEYGNGVYLSVKRITFIEVTPIAPFKSDPANLRKAALPGTLTGPLVKTKSIQGYALQSVLDQFAIKPEQTDVLNITAGNGNAVVSPGELKSDAAPIIVPRKAGDQEETTYDLVFPKDRSRTRWLENVDGIEIISLKQKPMIYVVGVGCGDPNLLTNEAISIMGKADAFVGKDDYQKTFAGYIAGKPVLFDPFMQLARYQKAGHPELTDEEAEKRADAVYASNIQMLRKALKEGKIVALLEPGDPTLYGGWRNWLSEYIPRDQLKVIAGMSSFSVANAVLGEYDMTQNPIIIAEPEKLRANESLIQTAAQNGSVMVVFMGLNRIKGLVSLLGKYFPPDTPLIVVYYAGIAGKERRVETSISKAIEVTAAEKESFLGLIYIGRDLMHSDKPGK
jgi:precorrin-2 methylase